MVCSYIQLNMCFHHCFQPCSISTWVILASPQGLCEISYFSGETESLSSIIHLLISRICVLYSGFRIVSLYPCGKKCINQNIMLYNFISFAFYSFYLFPQSHSSASFSSLPSVRLFHIFINMFRLFFLSFPAQS